MKKLGKCLKVIVIAVVLLMGFSFKTQTYAAPSTSQNIVNAGKNWINIGEQQQEDGKKTEQIINEFVDDFIGIGQILVSIGIATILIVTVIMAVKWITATPDKQAKLKQQLVGLVISIVVIFGAVGIWNLVRGIMTHVENNL